MNTHTCRPFEGKIYKLVFIKEPPENMTKVQNCHEISNLGQRYWFCSFSVSGYYWVGQGWSEWPGLLCDLKSLIFSRPFFSWSFFLVAHVPAGYKLTRSRVDLPGLLKTENVRRYHHHHLNRTLVRFKFMHPIYRAYTTFALQFRFCKLHHLSSPN